MTDYAIIYDATTGAQIGNYMGMDGSAAHQALPSGAALMLVPVEAWTTPVNIAVVQAAASVQIDAGADAVAAQIINLSPRRVQTAMAIKEESDLWTPTSTTPTPFLSALAAANGTTILAEKTLFDDEWAAVVPAGALINATAEAAKRKVSAATNLAEIAAAATINWSAVMATLSQP